MARAQSMPASPVGDEDADVPPELEQVLRLVCGVFSAQAAAVFLPGDKKLYVHTAIGSRVSPVVKYRCVHYADSSATQ